MSHEAAGLSDEWYTPKWIFDALDETFDLDPAGCKSEHSCVPALNSLTIDDDGLSADWVGFVWLNPPFGRSHDKEAWFSKFFNHEGGGIALSPCRGGTVWWHQNLIKADAVLFVEKRISFIQPNGKPKNGNTVGTCLWASGERAVAALKVASNNGIGQTLIVKGNIT